MAGSYAILQEHINALGAQMEKGFDEVKNLMQGFDLRLRTAENKEASCQPIITNRLDNQAGKIAQAERLIEAVQEEVKAIRSQVQELQASNRLLKWFAGLIGSAVVVWLVSAVLANVR